MTCTVSPRVDTRTQISRIWKAPICFPPRKMTAPWHRPASDYGDAAKSWQRCWASVLGIRSAPWSHARFPLLGPVASPPANPSYSSLSMWPRRPPLTWDARPPWAGFPTRKLHRQSGTSTLPLSPRRPGVLVRLYYGPPCLFTVFLSLDAGSSRRSPVCILFSCPRAQNGRGQSRCSVHVQWRGVSLDASAKPLKSLAFPLHCVGSKRPVDGHSNWLFYLCEH